MTISAATCVSGAIRVRKVEEQSAFLDDCSFQLGGGGGFKYFFWCSSLLGEDSHFDEHIFQLGWKHQLVDDCWNSHMVDGLLNDICPGSEKNQTLPIGSRESFIYYQS